MTETPPSLNVMIDVETFGRRPRGLVVSIGAVRFGTHDTVPLKEDTTPSKDRAVLKDSLKEFHAVLSWDAAVAASRFAINLETLHWWHEEKRRRAYERLCEQMRESRLNMNELLERFFNWLTRHDTEDLKVWANSPSFDLVILENAAKEAGIRYPVSHRAENDYRTLTDLVYGVNLKPRPPEDVAHDALEDARFQAGVCAQALQTVERWKGREL